jgi:hypothetical protein
MNLCSFSQSEILYRDILEVCPLGLTSTEAKKCICRKRLYHVPPADLRVLSCQFPNTFRGEPIRDPAAYVRTLRPVKPEKPPKIKAPKVTKERKPRVMSTSEAGTSLAKVDPSAGVPSIYDKISDPMAFVDKLGVTLYNSKMFGCANADMGKALAFMFAVKRIDPFDFRRRHHIIGGNVSMSSEAMLADFRQKLGGSHKIVTRSPECASVELTLGKQKQLFTFTLAEAIAEDYVYTSDANNGKVAKKLPTGEVNPLAWKDNWSTPRRRTQMLWARCVSDAVGAMAPEICGGHLTPEELGAVPVGSVNVESPTPPVGVKEDGEIIDAEYTVVETPAATAPASAPVAETPAAAPAAATTTAAANTGTGQPPFDVPDEAAQRLDLMKRLKPLKDEFLPAVTLDDGTTNDPYKRVLAKYGVTTAKELSIEHLTNIVHGLERRKQKKEHGDSMEQFVQSVEQGRSPPGN